MVVFFVIGTLALMAIFDILFIYKTPEEKKAIEDAKALKAMEKLNKQKPEFFESDLGITMADGGELIDDEEKKV